ncbi:MAG: putative Zn-dependent protease [Lysobacterales bacterium]|jgi:predicted Zn-dependent protease
MVSENMLRVKQLLFGWQRGLLAVLTILVSLSSIAQDDRIPLPDMGNSASNFLTEKEEKQYANALIRQMRAYEVLVEDPQISAYFENMGFQIVAHSDRPAKPFHFVVLDQSRINAFAAPGGVIALHSGLILAAESEHEVAGVLAHEVAHITQLHLYRTLESSQRMTIPIALAMLGLILAGGGSGDAVAGALMGGSGLAQQMQINFTRANESEADRIGIITLHRAGFDPLGMAGFFSKLNRLTRPNGEGPPEFLRTHPVTVNRIAEARNRAANMSPVEKSNGLDFFLMQARVRALLEENPAEAITYFEDKLQKGATGSEQLSLQYGLAISLQRHSDYERAYELLLALQIQDPGRLSYQLQLADLDLERKEYDPALQRMEDLYHSFQGNHAIAMQYSEALLAEEDPQRAETASIILRQQILFRPEDPELYALYAKAANISQDHVRATEAIAESYYQRGGTKEAIEQLERLSKDSELDYYQRARISDRLLELRIEIVETGEMDKDS